MDMLGERFAMRDMVRLLFAFGADGAMPTSRSVNEVSNRSSSSCWKSWREHTSSAARFSSENRSRESR
jgi:hypothetical protein